MNTFEEPLKKSHTSCCSATLAIDKRSWENTAWVKQQGEKKVENEEGAIEIHWRTCIIPADICPAEYIADEQKRPLCLTKIFFWVATVKCNLEFL